MKGGSTGCIYLRLEKNAVFSESLQKNSNVQAENILLPFGSETYDRKREDSCS